MRGQWRCRSVERGIQRRIAGQGEEKDDRGDAQKNPDQFVQPAVLSGRENTRKILHEGTPHSPETPIPLRSDAEMPEHNDYAKKREGMPSKPRRGIKLG